MDPETIDWDSLVGEAEQLAELDWSQLTIEEVIEALRAFCGHPAVVFAGRFCDVVRSQDDN